MVASLRSIGSQKPELEDHLQTEANYFEGNAERMRYPLFRSRGFFVGTGVMEAACKTIIGGRLKRSGMFWTVRGANSIIALRCCRLSGKFEDYLGGSTCCISTTSMSRTCFAIDAARMAAALGLCRSRDDGTKDTRIQEGRGGAHGYRRPLHCRFDKSLKRVGTCPQ